MHTNITTVKCFTCGEPIAPGEGTTVHVNGTTRFVHAGRQQEAQPRACVEDPEVENLLWDLTYDRD
jgi:hypothetical protein